MHREQVFHLLAEAAELEHNLLCSYLYAAFSLKQRACEDLRPAELDAVGRWRKAIMAVCIEEMVHLAQVSNLFAALGGRPHFNRPNLPVPPGYHPAGIVIELAPFGVDTLEHFIFLERPDEVPVSDPLVDSEAVEPNRPPPPPEAVMPAALDYDTIGTFYERLLDALVQLCAAVGEREVFRGEPELQVSAQELKVADLVVVTDLVSARLAIDIIVTQGEGSRSPADVSHFSRFLSIREEYALLRQERPAFRPARPVVRNPVMRPPQEQDRVHVTEPRAVALLDCTNAVYAVMLACLTQLYQTPSTSRAMRGALLASALAAMKALGDLASRLSSMPAQPGDETAHAGVTFTMLRATEGLADAHAMPILETRFAALAQRAAELDAVEAGNALLQGRDALKLP